MCRAVEEYTKKREARGRTMERLRMSCALIRKGRLTVDEAAADFDIPMETIQAYLDGHET